MNKRRVILVLLFIALTIASLLIGANTKVNLLSLLRGDKEVINIFLRSRVPRTVVIILAASSLSIAGLVMQALTRNKFISPQTAGTNNAAALGVLISYIILGKSSVFTRFGFAFLFAMISSLLFIYILNKIKFKNIIYVPLIGLIYGSLIMALSQLIAYETNMVQILSSLNLGTFSNIGLLSGSLILIMIPALILIVIFASKFNIVSLGEEFSTNLGVNYKLIIFVGLITTSLIAAASFIIVGPLPFIGLIIPNIVSIFYGDNMKKNLLDVALFGTVFVLINDIFSRLIIHPYEVSAGFTMGITGAIIFIYLIFRQGKTNE